MQFAQNAQKFAAAIIGLNLWLTPPCAASGLDVSPITLQLPAKGGAEKLFLANRGNEPVAVQVEAFLWQQTPDGEQLTPSDAIAISPPLARLAPGQRQTVRLLIKNDPTATHERAFRLIVSELPSTPTRSTALRMLLQFNIPVFAGDATPATSVEWTAERRTDGVWIAARNGGAGRAKFSELEFVARDGKKIQTQPTSQLAYVLAGATRMFKLKGAAPGQTLDIRARDPTNNQLMTLTSVVLAR